MRALINRLALYAICLPAIGSAQTLTFPSPQDIDRAMRRNAFPSGERLRAEPVPRPPVLDARPAELDIEALARKATALGSATPGSRHNIATLRVFITLDMPRESLLRLAEQASRAGVVLVLRGLKADSMRETLTAVRDLIGAHQVAWIIDPESFTRFGVTRAPTFLLSTTAKPEAEASPGCISKCGSAGTFVSIAGDVTIDYALETMARYRPEARERIRPLLAKLRGDS